MAALGDLEQVVMALLWEALVPVSVRAVFESVRGERDVAYTTVLTVMDRLHTKGHLSREMSGQAFLYSPVATRADYTAALMAGALDADPDRATALVHFTSRLTEQDVSLLRRALGRHRGQS